MVRETTKDNIFDDYIFTAYSSSCYSGVFSKNHMLQISDYPELFLYLDESIYKYLIKELQKDKSSDLDDFSKLNAVKNTVYGLIGQTNKINDNERYIIYRTNNNIASITDFFNKDISKCSERSALAHNYLRFLGIESYFVTAKITINDSEPQLHNFNIVKIKDDYYFFDLACCGSIKDQNGQVVKNPITKKLSNKEKQIFVASKKGLINKNQFLIDLSLFDEVNFCTSTNKKYKIKYGQSISLQKN